MTNGEYGMTRGGWPDAAPVVVGPFVSPSSLGFDSSHVGRFTFPLIEEEASAETRPAVRQPRVLWPEYTQAKFAYEAMAGEVLRQWQPTTFQGGLADHAVLAFTSPCDGDGKTGLLLGLAPCLAEQARGEVLIVDVDLRHSDLTSRISIEKGDTGRTESIYPTNVPNLSVLPAASQHKDRKFAISRIEMLRDRWPLTLLDMPSLAHKSAAPLASRCDGVYLVTRLGYTPRRSIVEAAHLIRTAGGRLLGCLVIQ
jgi:Mrp family chromosome partitioning ATPase